LSAFLKTTSASDIIVLGVQNFGGFERTASASGANYSSNSVSFTTGVTNTTATIYFYKPSVAGGNGYADSVSLVPNTSPPTYPPLLPPNSLANPYIDTYHPITVKNWKGITWDAQRLPNGMFDNDGIKSDQTNMLYAGVHWVRIWTDQSESLAALAQKVAMVTNIGLQPFIIFAKTNHTYGTPAEEAVTAAFLTNLVITFKGCVKYWEIGNEANLDSYWDLGGRVGEGTSDTNAPFNVGVHNYVLHLQNCYNAVKAADPAATVILGGVSSYMDDAFMTRLAAEQAYNYFDEAAFHPYADTPDYVMVAMNQFKSYVNAWPSPKYNMPIWITEIGYHATPGFNPGMQTDNEYVKGEYDAEAMQRLMQDMKIVRPVICYTLHEISSSAGFGLTQQTNVNGKVQYSRLPAIENYRRLNDHLPVVENQGFENSTISWSCYGSYATDSANAMYGGYGLKLGPSSGAEQTVDTLFPNTRYTATAYLKAASVGDTASFTVKQYGGADLIASTTNTTYTAKSIAFTTGPGNYSARIAVYKGSVSGSGLGYGDSVRLVQGSWSLDNLLPLPDGSCQVTIEGPPATNVVLEATTDFINWVPLATNAPFGGGLIFDDAQIPALNLNQRFYRANIQP
jgi:hypothetical protein